MLNKSSTPSLQLIQSKLEHFPPYISRYVNYKKVGNSVTNTVSNYLIDFRTFFEWLCDEEYYSGELKEVPLSVLEKLRLEDIQGFIEYRRSQEADRTVNRRLAALKDLFYYLSQLAEDNEGFPIMRHNVMAKVKLLKIDESESFRANQIHEKILHVNEQHNEVQEFLEFIRTGYPALYPDNKKIQNFHQTNNDVVKLKRQLRHRSIRTTMIYTHVSDPDLKDAVVRTNNFTPRVEK